ncbi:cytochrome P450 [Streptomyces sp. NPDC059096]|uniref:cytochrome P450 n=1 Tax=unclassified Streptomyces TaxID=2593676 RepID=UPI0036B97731
MSEPARLPRQLGAYPFEREHCLSPFPHTDLLDQDRMAVVTMPSGHPAHLAVRHADVVRVLADRRFSRRAMLTAPDGPRMTHADLDEPSLLGLDPPDHTRVRRLCAPALSARAVEALRPALDTRVTRLLDSIDADAVADRPVDLHRAFSLPLATGMVCDLLGVPEEQRAPLLHWSRQKLALTSLPPDRTRAGHQALRAHWHHLLFGGPHYGSGLSPGGGLLRTLLQSHQHGSISRAELLATAVNLYVAGHATTAATLTNGLLHLLIHRDQWQALRRDPALIDRAVLEILRYDTIADAALPRLATSDIRLGRTRIRAGEAVIPSHAHADRDPRVFTDPHTFDITRTPGPLLAFGHGPHRCIGARLALLELSTAFLAFSRRHPGLTVSRPVTRLPFLNGSLIGGVAQLPATGLGPATS